MSKHIIFPLNSCFCFPFSPIKRFPFIWAHFTFVSTIYFFNQRMFAMNADFHLSFIPFYTVFSILSFACERLWRIGGSQSGGYEEFSLLLKVNQRFGGTYRLNLQGWRVNQARNQHFCACFMLIFSWFTLQPWRWRRHVPPKRQLTFQQTIRLYIQDKKIKLFGYKEVCWK
jgi:hypothetical protein